MAPDRLRVKGMSHESRDFVGLMSVVTLARLIGQICEFLRFLSSHPGLFCKAGALTLGSIQFVFELELKEDFITHSD